MQQTKMEKKFFVSEIIGSENVATNFLCEEENTYCRQSMGYQTLLRF